MMGTPSEGMAEETAKGMSAAQVTLRAWGKTEEAGCSDTARAACMAEALMAPGPWPQL